MATSKEIGDCIEKLDKKWIDLNARNGHFGNILKSVKIQNIRGISTTIEFSWPVTVIAGINGSGKTSFLQACSSAYTAVIGGRHYKLGNWIRGALVGETPAVKDPAFIEYGFWDGTPSFNVPYQPSNTRWRYPRRNNPHRHVEFIGITSFAPRIERNDRIRLFSSRLEVRKSTLMSTEAVQSISRILGFNYDRGAIQVVGIENGTWNESLPQLTRSGYTYTESHMGAGEQKIVNIVDALEAVPERSLILLEEPEITLHPDAQRGLAWYLMNLSIRKGHQVIIASHSTEIFSTLPPAARILLTREDDTIQAYHRIPALQAARELSGSINTNKELILVEDEIGANLLREILMRYNRKLLEDSTIVPVGNTENVYKMTKSLRDRSVRVVGVRDPDIGSSSSAGVFSLPGSKCPEALLLEEDNIDRSKKYISGIGYAVKKSRAVIGSSTGSAAAKKHFTAVASELGVDLSYLADRLTLAWLDAKGEEAKELVKAIIIALPVK